MFLSLTVLRQTHTRRLDLQKFSSAHFKVEFAGMSKSTWTLTLLKSLEVSLGLLLAPDHIRGRYSYNSFGRYKAQLCGVFPPHLPFKHPWEGWFWCVYCYLSWQSKVPPGTWNHSLGLRGSVSSLFLTMQFLRTQSSFPAFTANIFNPVIQSSKSQLESKLKSPHADFVRVCMWILSGLSDKLAARRPQPWCLA